jgi:hypothetical protein
MGEQELDFESNIVSDLPFIAEGCFKNDAD